MPVPAFESKIELFRDTYHSYVDMALSISRLISTLSVQGRDAQGIFEFQDEQILKINRDIHKDLVSNYLLYRDGYSPRDRTGFEISSLTKDLSATLTITWEPHERPAWLDTATLKPLLLLMPFASNKYGEMNQFDIHGIPPIIGSDNIAKVMHSSTAFDWLDGHMLTIDAPLRLGYYSCSIGIRKQLLICLGILSDPDHAPYADWSEYTVFGEENYTLGFFTKLSWEEIPVEV